MLLGLWKVPHLVELDLSENDIDEAAGALRKYLSSTSCTLQRLYMSAADVDDNECADMMAALETNTSLLHLDLSANLIGEKETYNSVFPDYITGGEGIAQMLDTNTSMTNLDVSWNSIRLESAVALGKAVRDCCLIHLNVSHNSLGKDGGLWLAHSLRRNATLKTLDISYNGLPPGK
jgi:Ran GTPase-activating protein (RanGAP) involved in mRNA processing and transport